MLFNKILLWYMILNPVMIPKIFYASLGYRTVRSLSTKHISGIVRDGATGKPLKNFRFKATINSRNIINFLTFPSVLFDPFMVTGKGREYRKVSVDISSSSNGSYSIYLKGPLEFTDIGEWFYTGRGYDNEMTRMSYFDKETNDLYLYFDSFYKVDFTKDGPKVVKTQKMKKYLKKQNVVKSKVKRQKRLKIQNKSTRITQNQINKSNYIAEAQKSACEKFIKKYSKYFTQKMPIYPEMVFIPTGEVWLGSNKYDGYGWNSPMVKVKLDAFYISKYEITDYNNRYCNYRDDNYKPSIDHSPIHIQSYEEYLRKLKYKTGVNFELPTEAQWVRAARGDSKKDFIMNKDDLITKKNFNQFFLTEPYENRIPVGLNEKDVSEFGVCGMQGSVPEIVRDMSYKYFLEEIKYFGQKEKNPYARKKQTEFKHFYNTFRDVTGDGILNAILINNKEWQHIVKGGTYRLRSDGEHSFIKNEYDMYRIGNRLSPNGLRGLGFRIVTTVEGYKKYKEKIAKIEKAKIEKEKNKKLKKEKKIKDKETRIIEDLRKNMVHIKGGEYIMGDVFNEGKKDEKPVHEVELSSFYMHKYEITFGEFNLFCKKTNRKQRNTRQNVRFRSPYLNNHYDSVSNVTWYEAVDFCNWLSDVHGYERSYDKNYNCDFSKNGYRLPTEAEWEYAARETGKKVRFGNGKNIVENRNSFIIQYAEYVVLFGKQYVKKYRNFQKITDDSKDKSQKANLLGLHNMSGNAAEWCEDWYFDDFYSKSDYKNPICKINTGLKVVRGGSFKDYEDGIRNTRRDSFAPKKGDYYIGFRIVRGDK